MTLPGVAPPDVRVKARAAARALAFPTECHGGSNCELTQVVEGPIAFSALCEHHALPFLGQAYVGYVAHENMIGVSKLTRLVRVITRRFGVQERMTHQIGDSLE